MKTTISTILAVVIAAIAAGSSIFLPCVTAADDQPRADNSNADIVVRRNLFSPVIAAASGVVGFSNQHRRIQEETNGTPVPTFSLSNLDDELVDLLEDIGLGIDDLTDIEFDDLTGLDDDTLMGGIGGGDDAFLDEMLGAIFSPEVMACAADMEGIMTDELAAAEKAIEDYTEEASNTAMENMDPSSSDYSTQIIIPDDLIQAHQRSCEDSGGIFTLYSKFDCGGDDFLGLGMSVQVDTVGMTECVADTENCASLDVTALAGTMFETMGMTCTSEISPSGAVMPVEIVGDDGVGDAPTTDDPEAEDAVVTKEGDAAAVTSTGFFRSSSAAAMVLAATTTVLVGSIV